MSLNNKTLFISGASRGIGLAIALKAAQDGANIAIAAKTAEPHPKLEGTIYTAAEEIEKAGGKAYRAGPPTSRPPQPIASRHPRYPRRRRQIPIDRARGTTEPNPPAVSSPEASPTPANRPCRNLVAAAGVREPLTGADTVP